MKAVIMAGGKGTRLQSIAKDIPKPMFPILDKPILEYQVESLKKCGIIDVTLIVGYLGDIIKDYFGDGQKFGVSIDYIVEEVPLGTAGALHYLKDKVDSDFVLLFGDLILDVDWERFMEFHKRHRALITLYGHPNSHPYDSDIIVVDKDNRVIKIESKSIERNFYYHNLVNAGLYCVNSKLLDLITDPIKIDLEKKIIADQILKGTVFAYHSTEYVKDMGTPDRLDVVTRDVLNGVVESRNLKNKQKAVFLNEEGTIKALNEHLPELVEAIGKINTSQYLIFITSNQPVFREGEYSIEESKKLHKKMETVLGERGVYVDGLFDCLNTPYKYTNYEVTELKTDDECRKSEICSFWQETEKYNIDLAQSWFICDPAMDLSFCEDVEIKRILIVADEDKNKGINKEAYDYSAPNITDAVNYILGCQ